MENDKTKKKNMDIKNLISSDKARIYLIVIALVVVVIMFFLDGDDKENHDVSEYDADTYHSVLTQNVLDMVKSVEGAGESKVLITLENSYEYIYLDDGKTLRMINEPTIRGVAVACDGGDSAGIREHITELLTTVLNIPSTKVCISKLI